MNWFKNAANIDWQGKEFHHLINVMKFEIDNFPNLSLDESRGAIQPEKLGFYIIRDNGEEYYFAIQKMGENIRTTIITKPLRQMGTNTYNTNDNSPYEIIENGLIIINNDINKGLNL